jgi:hypothetical protein
MIDRPIQGALGMKQYIVTAPDGTEGVAWANSLVELAVLLDNSRYIVRAIEEIPTSADAKLPTFYQIKEGWPQREA